MTKFTNYVQKTLDTITLIGTIKSVLIPRVCFKKPILFHINRITKVIIVTIIVCDLTKLIKTSVVLKLCDFGKMFGKCEIKK